MKKWLFILLATSGLALIVFIWNQSRPPDAIQSTIVGETSSKDQEGFSRALEVRPFSFPDDHGPHPNYQTEWWYYTGNLQAEDGHRFGYQLTFFRRSLQPIKNIEERPSQWASSQVYMAHFALSDIDGQQFRAYERLARGAAGLSGARAAPYRVWLQDWNVEEIGPNALGFQTYRLTAAQGEIKLDLILDDLKGPIAQGDQGFSRKGPEAGQASYYYSLTQLKSSGEVVIGEKSYRVDGFSWMDHEFSTSVLAQDQVGWDWFSFHLDDGSELMVFQIRKADGSIDPFSSGTWISLDGRPVPLTQQDFRIQISKNWTSPHSKANYPAGWMIEIPKLELKLTIEPHLADQELNLSYSYWEGAVMIKGERGGQPVQGNGYVELTGYSTSMGGEF